MKRTLLAVLVLFHLLACASAKEQQTEVITGKVISVADGDTLTILDEAKKKTRVRLLAIDAPEKSQAFGNQSKKLLSKLTFGKEATVKVFGSDKYGRALGIVYVGSTVCNLEMVRNGLAWHYRKYSQSKTVQKLEDEARKKKVGLWADPNPNPPWDYRKSVKDKEPNPDADSSGVEAEEEKYWITSKSGIRHNSSCRWYKRSKGRPCGKNEGRPCKQCGG